MRGGGVVVVVACGLLAAACAGSAEVVSRTEGGVVLRWDERGTGPGRVAEQAFNLCSGHGFNARRAVVLADDVDGTTHTTRYACQPTERGKGQAF